MAEPKVIVHVTIKTTAEFKDIIEIFMARYKPVNWLVVIEEVQL